MSRNIADSFVIVSRDSSSCATRGDKAGDQLHAISEYVAGLSSALRKVSLEIHDHPELQYKETHAHRILVDFMCRQSGWQVTPSAYSIATAFVAVFDSKRPGPVVSFNAEYDALKGIGNACGHNLIAVSSVGAALAAADRMHNEGLGGKVVLFGTPAEEGGGGKIKLLNAGAYSDNNVDISLIAHPGISANAALVRTAAYSSFRVEYFGKEAHAAARPWDGINALDALITAYNAISVLRQQTQPGDIIQGMITDGGLRPNIIHAHSAGQFVVRSGTKARLDALMKRVMACFEAGATATGARLEIKHGSSYLDNVPNHALGRTFRRFFNDLGGEIPEGEIDELKAVTQASTDQGNISHAMPSLHAGFWIRSEDDQGRQLGGPHTPDFEKAARTDESHDMAMNVAKALAATAVEVLKDRKLLADVKSEFEESPLI